MGWLDSRQIAAFDIAALYAQHGAAARRRIRRFLPEEEADGALEEVLRAASGARRTLDGRIPASAWLYALTTRRCLERLRVGDRRSLLSEDGELGWARPLAGDAPPRAALVRGGWRELEPEALELGVYYLIDGAGAAQIAWLLGARPRSTWARLGALERALGGPGAPGGGDALLNRGGHVLELTLDRYLADELTPADRLRAQEHMGSCLECARRLRQARAHAALPLPALRLG